VKARRLNSYLFAVFCEKIKADHKSLLLYSVVIWVSRGKRLVVFKEVAVFSNFCQHFLDKKWLALLPYFLYNIR
jgi:hypothetical protein